MVKVAKKEKWVLLPVNKLANIVLGGTPKRSVAEYWDGNVKWATPIDIVSCETRFIRNTKERITNEGLNNSSAKLLSKNTVVITARGTVGALTLLPEPMAFNQSCYGLICNEKVDPTFFYFALKSRINHIKSQTYGAVFDTITKNSFKQIYMPVPPYVEQRKIAAILSAYDDLIENNLCRIKILEEMAQALYKEWFVHFRFPGHEKVRMVDSPLGKIPEGWNVAKIGELLNKVKRKKTLKQQEYEGEGKIPVVDQGKELVGGYTNNNELLHENPLPIIVFGDHTRVVKYVDFPFVRGADGTQLLLSNTDRLPTPLFYYTLKNIDLSDYSYARHFKFLKEIQILIPEKEIAASFEQIVAPIRDQITCLLNINKVLSQTRDLLLPKLISGEIDVSDLDIDTGRLDE